MDCPNKEASEKNRTENNNDELVIEPIVHDGEKETPESVLIRQYERSEFFEGPLPHPTHLAQYAALYPEAAKFFFENAKDQIAHRQLMDKEELSIRREQINLDKEQHKTFSRDSIWGIVSALIVVLTSLVLGFFLIINGKEIPGTILSTTGLAGLAGTFMYGAKEGHKTAQIIKNLLISDNENIDGEEENTD